MYLKLKFSIFAILILALGGFNFVVDPYGVYLPERSFVWNQNKTQFFLKEPIIKPYRVSDVAPDTVILGMSSAGLGYDENHPAFAGQSVYNFSIAGASMYQVYRSFQHALAQGNLRRVLLDLNMISFNEYHKLASRSASSDGQAFEDLIAVTESGTRNWLAPLRPIVQIPRFLLSWSVTRDSLATLSLQGPYDGWNLNSRGSWRGSSLPPRQSQGRRFMATERLLLGDFFRKMSNSDQFSIYNEAGEPSQAFDYYRRLLAEAMDNNVEVVQVLSPMHAYFYEAIRYHGLMSQYRDWQRRIVRINELVAANRDKPPYPIWDFTGYSELTTEPVPPGKDRSARMHWYFDPTHFQRPTGDRVLDQIYLGRPGSGVLINSANVVSVQAAQESGRAKYQRENPEAIERLQQEFRSISGKEPQ